MSLEEEFGAILDNKPNSKVKQDIDWESKFKKLQAKYTRLNTNLRFKDEQIELLIKEQGNIPRKVKEAIIFLAQKVETQYQRDGKNIMTKKIKEKYEIVMNYIFEKKVLEGLRK